MYFCLSSLRAATSLPSPLSEQTNTPNKQTHSQISMDLNVLHYFPSFIRTSSNPNIKSSINLSSSSSSGGDQSSISTVKFRPNHRRLSPAKSIPKTDVYESSGVELKADEDVKEIVNPVYVPTPTNRPLRTPHSG